VTWETELPNDTQMSVLFAQTGRHHMGAVDTERYFLTEIGTPCSPVTAVTGH
jgi:hypothetical protein